MNKKYSWIEILKSFFDASIMPVAWFVIVILILYILFYIIYKYFKVKENIKFICMLTAEIILILIMYLVGCGSWWYCSILAFAFGVFLAGNETISKKIFYNKYVKYFSLITFIVIYIYASYFNINNGFIFTIIKFIQSLLICVLYYNFSKKYIIKNKILNIIGENSLLIYMIHPLFYRVISKFDVLSNADYLVMVVLLIVSLFTSIVYNYFKDIRKIKSDRIKKNF